MKKQPKVVLTICVVAFVVITGVTIRAFQSAPPSVSGTITIDGVPIEKGSITFYPAEGTGGGTTGGIIENGEFEITELLVQGDYHVAVDGSRQDGMEPDRWDNDVMVPVWVQVVPEKYHGPNSPLLVTLESGHQPLSWDLRTDHKTGS